MTVEQFKDKYEALQKEGSAIHEEIKPLFKRLRALASKCSALGNKIDGDKDLFDTVIVNRSDNDGNQIAEEHYITKGWNIRVESRLWEFSHDNNSVDLAMQGIDNLLYNLTETAFKKPVKQKRQEKVYGVGNVMVNR